MNATSTRVASSAASIALLTVVAMLAFAANSLLCRLALGQALIDAASFSTIRVIAGALTLGVIATQRGTGSAWRDVNWRSSFMLFTYMACFSFAYLSLSAGTGALILFGAVQLTMFTASLRSGEHFPLPSWFGLCIAILGLVYLVFPGLTAPDPLGALLMTLAGIAWGFYSLLGRGVADPLRSSANNFMGAVPLVLGVSLLFISQRHATTSGVTLAVISGAITSGLGYVAWYAALRGLTGTRAATVQLSVPMIAAFGGVAFLSEQISTRLLVASVATLGGVWIVLSQRSRVAVLPVKADGE